MTLIHNSQAGDDESRSVDIQVILREFGAHGGV